MQRDDEQGLDRGIAYFGPGDWIDLSTGLNRHRWPVKSLPPQPAASATAALRRAAAQWLDCDPAQVLPVADPWCAVLRLPPGRAACAKTAEPLRGEHPPRGSAARGSIVHQRAKPPREPLRFAFLSRLSYWCDIRCDWICAMKSITTTTTISSDVPPK